MGKEELKALLSHALFWVMTASVKGKIGKEKFLLLLLPILNELVRAEQQVWI